MTGAYLEGADLEGADLTGTELKYANLEDTKGLISQQDYLNQNFEKVDEGYIIHKTFNEHKAPPARWDIKPGNIIEETVNMDRRIECSYGINGGTVDYVSRRTKKPIIWVCLLHNDWIDGVCVPYATNGKIRSSKLKLLKSYDREEWMDKRND